MTSNPDALRRLPELRALWIVGCGQMGGSMLARWVEAGLPPDRVTIIDPAPRCVAPEKSIRTVAAPGEALATPTLVVLAVKPQKFPEVAPAVRAAFGAARPIILSLMAGVRMQALGSAFPDCPSVRTMPNLPVRIGKGAIALHAPALESSDRRALDALLAAGGRVVPLDDERQFDAVTALAGSGPAFVYRFMEALAGAGEAAGLDPELARELALQTVVGAAALAESSGLAPSQLRQQVTSPGGTTEAGLDVLDGDGALSALLRSTLRAAAERSRQLAAASEAEAGALAVSREQERA